VAMDNCLNNSLLVGGITSLNNSLIVQSINILNDINNSNGTISDNSATIDVDASSNIIFNINDTQLTKIDTTGLSAFNDARETPFSYNYAG
jgi:hypothetical protein